ncbi:hypothetical protein FACHB389_30220 [Nostoc calcicola FACHB-389]|nr:hypothetical protein [Nostoc calcicola FACHB-3891]OKH23888.1 hypothetical protein FACHB389_30220 [Nostoc calcicola FACHB-389]
MTESEMKIEEYTKIFHEIVQYGKEFSMDNSKMKDEEYIKVLREMLRHENELSNQRLTWMTTLNGLMFTALGFIWSGKYDPLTSMESDHILIAAFCILGFVISCSGLIALQMAEDAKKHFKKLWKDKNIQESEIPPIMGITLKGSLKHFLLPWNIIPWSLIVFWCLLFLLNFGSFVRDLK